jgi:hypothetical protein
MTVNRESLAKLGRFLLRGLRIGASTVAVVELLRNDWTGGISAGVAWLVFLQVERRLPPSAPSLRSDLQATGQRPRSHDEGCGTHRPPPWHPSIVRSQPTSPPPPLAWQCPALDPLHRMTLSTPSRPPSTPASGPLRREQIDALLEELRDPALARQFLMDAGLIDADGQLTPPYRSQDARSA